MVKFQIGTWSIPAQVVESAVDSDRNEVLSVLA